VRRPTWVLGYHGCERAVAEKVLGSSGEHLQLSKNTWDWLGSGIYFWENNPQRALDWAKKHKKDPAVVGAIIDLGECLDLLEAESIGFVEEAYNCFLLFLKTADRSLPQNTGGQDRLKRALDCEVINHFHWMLEQDKVDSYDSVRAAFVEGDPIYPEAGFHKETHIQMCVRNPEQIMGYFRVLEDLTA
jgi:hypothetical protein